MKKIFLLVLVFVLCFSCFGQEKLKSDLDVGLVYGHGTAYYDEYSNGIKIKNLNANGFGVFLGGTVEFNKHFGLFGELNFIFPVKTSIDASVNGISFSIDDYMKAKFVMTDLIGLCGIIPISERFKLRLRGGFDFGLTVLKMDLETNGYSVSGTEVDLMFGLGLKAVGIFMFNEKVGLNFGLNADFYFGGVAKSEISNGRYKQSKSDSFSRNINFIRPQVGLTVHFDK